MLGNRRVVATEYAKVHARPTIKALVQALVVLVDICVMFVLIWTTCTYLIPSGSWMNVVQGNSMDPTLKNGQIIFTDTTQLERGDFIVVNLRNYSQSEEKADENHVMIKRIIGMPGDELKITPDGVYVNGELFNEPYLTEDAKIKTYIEDKYNSMRLSDDMYFIMGDNRGVSYDSRYFGAVRMEDVMYKQSETPTFNFWIKLLFVVLLLALDVFLYALIEFILTETAYGILYHKELKNIKTIDNSKGEEKNVSNGI